MYFDVWLLESYFLNHSLKRVMRNNVSEMSLFFRTTCSQKNESVFWLTNSTSWPVNTSGSKNVVRFSSKNLDCYLLLLCGSPVLPAGDDIKKFMLVQCLLGVRHCVKVLCIQVAGYHMEYQSQLFLLGDGALKEVSSGQQNFVAQTCCKYLLNWG